MTFLRWPDSEVEATLALRREFVHQIRYHRPDLVITHDPVPRTGPKLISHGRDKEPHGDQNQLVSASTHRTGDERTPLFPAAELNGFRSRWDSIQTD